MKKLFNVISFIIQHALGKRHKIKSLSNFVLWQLRQKIFPGLKIVYFSEGVKMYVNKNDTGVTGNIYVGIHDFQEIFFALHFLREEEIFADVGANVGFYSVYLSKVKKVKSFSFEPIPSTYKKLLNNITLNDISNIVIPNNIAIGSTEGQITMSSNLDTVNHIKLDNENQGENIVVPIKTLDSFFEISTVSSPVLIKIDVEGFETEVIKGMKNILGSHLLKAIIIELNGSGGRYGYDEGIIHELLLANSFLPFEYEPFSRHLTQLSTFGQHNTLYIRDFEFVSNRLKSSKTYQIFGEHI